MAENAAGLGDMTPQGVAVSDGAPRHIETEMLRQRALRMVELAIRLKHRWSAINAQKPGAEPVLKPAR